MTHLEFLEDMLHYYTTDVNKRSNNGSYCAYLMDDGRKCAIGRFLTKEDIDNCRLEGLCVDNYRVLSRLPKEIQNLGTDFLCQMQKLHDNMINWTNNGLSNIGEKQVASIREEYCK